VAHAAPSIVIAEPLRDQGELYFDYLTWAGFHVRLAATGAEVLDASLTASPDVIITNFMLGDCTAPELCVRVHSHVATKSVPVIVLSTSMGSADADRAVDAGCVAVLTKPVLPEALLSEVRKCLRRSQTLEASAARLHRRAMKARGDAASSVRRAQDIVTKTRRRK
jgi:DNA-binding response OmpR family regulator